MPEINKEFPNMYIWKTSTLYLMCDLLLSQMCLINALLTNGPLSARQMRRAGPYGRREAGTAGPQCGES